MITFIVPYKEDNIERAKNLEYAKKYYSKLVPGSEFILVTEEDMLFGKTLDYFPKSQMYNLGAKRAKHDILCFLDADTFVSEESLMKGISLASNDNNVIIGYSGVAIYLTFKAKAEIGDEVTYDKLLSFLPNGSDYKPVLGHRDDIFNVANLKAVGGCLIMNKNCFNEIGGYNPNFKGWGYEDTEIIKRSIKLKKDILAVKPERHFLFHLAHEDDTIPRCEHPHYKDNEAEFYKILDLDYKQLKDYIKTWTLQQ